MTEFDEDTALVRQDGAWHGRVTDRWMIGRGPNGGYLASFFARAFSEEAPHPDPLTMTIHYLDRPLVGPVEVVVKVLRVGRSHATMAGQLRQAGRPIAAALITVGRRRPGGPESIQAAMPTYPPPAECVPMLMMSDLPEMTFRGRFDNLIRQDEPAFYERTEPGPAVIGGWTRLVDRPLDDLAVPMFMDCWPPAMFATMLGGYAPTVELTVHWRGAPGEGWHLAQFTSRFLVEGYVEEDGELWSEDGRLVAQSRQLALFIPPA